MNSKFLIYALVDPRTDEVRYIGKSTRGLSRPKDHLKLSVLNGSKTYKNSWILHLLALGLKPKIQILEVFDSDEDLSDAECFWIAQGRGLGWRLTNLTKGGDGATGCVFSEERRRKVSETSSRVLAPDPALVERARVLYVDEKKTGREVGKILGVHDSTISDWGQKGGWSRSIGESRVLVMAPDQVLVERARVLYVEEKKTSKEVGKLINRDWKTVLRWAHAGGWARSVKESCAPDPALIERARCLYVEERKSSVEVAEILGVTKGRVSYWANRGGWVRSKGEAVLLWQLRKKAA